MAKMDFTPVSKLVRLPGFLDSRVKKLKTDLKKQLPKMPRGLISENLLITVAVNDLLSQGPAKILKKVEEYQRLKFKRK